MSDIEQILSEAERAQAEAEAAIRRAAELETRATAARRQLAAEQEGRQRAWAQQVIDAYEADLAEADRALHEAASRFEANADDLAAAIQAYLAWAEAATRHYVLQVRAATVAPVVGLALTEPESVPPPPFSQALDAALDHRVATRSAQLRDEAEAEIAVHLDDATDGAPGGQASADSSAGAIADPALN